MRLYDALMNRSQHLLDVRWTAARAWADDERVTWKLVDHLAANVDNRTALLLHRGRIPVAVVVHMIWRTVPPDARVAW